MLCSSNRSKLDLGQDFDILVLSKSMEFDKNFFKWS